MCRFFGVSRSGYYDFVRRIGKPEKDAELAAAIRQQQEKSFNTYGYRRMCLALEAKGIHCNPKTILRVMKKYDLLSEIRRRRKWVNMGQQLHRYENLLNRQFRADKPRVYLKTPNAPGQRVFLRCAASFFLEIRQYSCEKMSCSTQKSLAAGHIFSFQIHPNRKWVTDISYIHTKQGILYLSMIRDLYDNSIVAYKTGTEQTVNLVLDTIHLAMRKEKKRVAAELYLHSDQGFQYTSQAYFKLTQEYGITPSMSRRGNCYDNAMAENFFSILKTECIYRHKPVSFNEANEMIDRYIHFYNHERIQTKTGVAPLTLRHSA